LCSAIRVLKQGSEDHVSCESRVPPRMSATTDLQGAIDHKPVMRSTKRAYAEMQRCVKSPSSVTKGMLQSWMDVVADANADVAAMVRHAAAQKERRLVDQAILADEMRCELVDREANAALTAERFRIMLERDLTAGRSLTDRACAHSASIEHAIGRLCPHPRVADAVALVVKEQADAASDAAQHSDAAQAR